MTEEIDKQINELMRVRKELKKKSPKRDIPTLVRKASDSPEAVLSRGDKSYTTFSKHSSLKGRFVSFKEHVESKRGGDK